MFDYLKFGKGVQHYRKKKGLTQNTFSEKIDMGEQYLNKIENGKVKPSLKAMIDICNELEVSVTDCLNPDRTKDMKIVISLKDKIIDLDTRELNLIKDIIIDIKNL